MSARRYLRLTPEVTWGTYNGAGTPIIVDLDQANSYTVRKKPMRTTTRSAGSKNVNRRTQSNKYGLGGGLNFICYGSQMAALASWFTAAPGSVATLPSMTVDFALVMEDGAPTTVYSRHLGVQVQQAQLGCSEQDPILRAALTLVGGSETAITITDFPEPALTAYPTDAWYVLEHLAGGLTIASSRTEFAGFSCTIKNILDVCFFESTTPTRIRYCGRDVTWSVPVIYKTAADRAALEGVTAVSGTALFTNGSHTLTFAMETENFFDDVADSLDDNKAFRETLNLTAFLDTTATTDFAITGT